MPYLLDAPIPVHVNLDPAGDITHVRAKLHDNDPDEKTANVSITYGRMPESAFIRSDTQPVGNPSHTIKDPEYTDIVTTHQSLDGELTYVAVKRAIYEHLESEGIIPAGTIV